MKYLILLFLLVSSVAYSQSLKVSGKIIDSLDHNPVEACTITLSSKIVGFSDRLGGFTLDLNSNQLDSIVIISSIGYVSKRILISDLLNKKPDVTPILLWGSKEQLGLVEVKAKRKLYENTLDKLIYNVEDDKTAVGKTTLDVLRASPFITVGPGGDVEIKGKAGVKILLNGKPFGSPSGGLNDALKNLSGADLKRIEIVSNPSAKEDAEGIAGVVNIVTKRKVFQGINGSSYVNAGTRLNNAGGNLLFGGNQLNLTLSSDVSHDQIKSKTLLSRSNLALGDSFDQELQSKNKVFSQNHILALNWQLKSDQSVSFGGNYTTSRTNSPGDMNSIYKADTGLSSYRQHINSQANDQIWGLNAGYIKTFNNAKGNISLAYSFTRDNGKNRVTSQFDPEAPGFSDFINLNATKYQEHAAQLDYENAFGKIKPLDFQMGVKYNVRDFFSNANLNQAIPGPPLDLNQKIYASYIVLQKQLDSTISIQAGNRWELTDNMLLGTGNRYMIWAPSGIIKKQLNTSNSVKLAFNRRIQRPGIIYLNPFVNNQDPLNISFGNQGLRPEKSNNIDLSFDSFKDSYSISYSFSYLHTSDVINQFRSVNADTTKTTYDNLGRSNALTFNVFVNTSVIKDMNINCFAGAGYYDFIDQDTKVNSGFRYNITINHSWKVSKLYSMNSFINYSSKRINFQGWSRGSLYSTFEIRRSIWQGKGSFAFSVDNPFQNDFKISDYSKDNNIRYLTNNYITGRSFKLNFYLTFGKENNKSTLKTKQIQNDDIKAKEPEY